MDRKRRIGGWVRIGIGAVGGSAFFYGMNDAPQRASAWADLAERICNETNSNPPTPAQKLDCIKARSKVFGEGLD
jgi:hypothetical protein